MAPVWETLAWRDNDTKLRYFRCRHGLLAVSLTSSCGKAIGPAQIVLFPTSLGAQNASMALSTAQRARYPDRAAIREQDPKRMAVRVNACRNPMSSARHWNAH
jgi:hypothetical protein